MTYTLSWLYTVNAQAADNLEIKKSRLSAAMVVTNFYQFISASAPEQWTFPGQNGRHYADGILRSILVKEKFDILIKISLKFVPKDPVYNNPALAQIMAWHQISDKPL